MSAGFTVLESVALTGFSCAPGAVAAATAGTACALCGCAASAEESLGLSRMAAPPTRRQETAAIVSTDKRRKNPSRKTTHLDANPQLSTFTSYHRSSPLVQWESFEYLVPSTVFRMRVKGAAAGKTGQPGGKSTNLPAACPAAWYSVLGTCPFPLRKLFLFLSLSFPLRDVLIWRATI